MKKFVDFEARTKELAARVDWIKEKGGITRGTIGIGEMIEILDQGEKHGQGIISIQHLVGGWHVQMRDLPDDRAERTKPELADALWAALEALWHRIHKEPGSNWYRNLHLEPSFKKSKGERDCKLQQS